jgi:DHA2 family multidrug resistance protein-like MFS transporter
VKGRGGNEAMIAASVLQAAGLGLLAAIGLDGPLLVMVAALTLGGVGSGVAYSAATSVGLSEIAGDDAGEASALLTMLRLLGLSVGVALSTALVHAVDDSTSGSSPGIQFALALGAVVTLAGVPCVTALGRRPVPQR